LSETLSERDVAADADTEEYRIMKQAMETIHRRSKGLLSFVEKYRKLTRVPQPTRQAMDVALLFKSLHQLVESDNIHFTYSVYPYI
jgi:nitrogen fixation/metabolism regulation signal transduction histidine kinase